MLYWYGWEYLLMYSVLLWGEPVPLEIKCRNSLKPSLLWVFTIHTLVDTNDSLKQGCSIVKIQYTVCLKIIPGSLKDIDTEFTIR